MINKIINAISNAIYKEFCTNPMLTPNKFTDYEIYTEQVDQDLKEPCFLIQHVESSLKPIITPRYYFKNTFDILYFSDQISKSEDFNTRSFKLYSVLEFVKTEDNDKLHGTNMNHKIIDDVLHFYVDYNLILRREDVIIDGKMENIKINTRGK